MVGQWTITNKNQEDKHTATGAITINADSTFNLSEGSFAAIGMGSDPTFCDHTDANQTYEVIANGVILFTHINDANNANATNTVIPTLASLKQDEIVFVGKGGCGTVDQQRISILTRVE